MQTTPPTLMVEQSMMATAVPLTMREAEHAAADARTAVAAFAGRHWPRRRVMEQHTHQPPHPTLPHVQVQAAMAAWAAFEVSTSEAASSEVAVSEVAALQAAAACQVALEAAALVQMLSLILAPHPMP